MKFQRFSIPSITLCVFLTLPFFAKASDSLYMKSPNYGKKIAVFGGSFSRIKACDVVKDYWREVLNLRIDTYGINGAGFSETTGKHKYIPLQVDSACRSGKKYDICILWASTNDCKRRVSLQEQNAQIVKCVKKLRKEFPDTKVVLFTSLPVPLMQAKGKMLNIHEYVEAQITVGKELNVSVLDLYSLSGINKWNAIDFFSSDSLHMNANGYNHIKEMSARFLSAQ